MEENHRHWLCLDAAAWRANDDSSNLSILCRLEPRNQYAHAVTAFNRDKANRVTTHSTEHGVAVEMLQISFKEPKQRRGLIMFGRYPSCSVLFPDRKVSLDHCYIDLNPLSGVLRVYDTSKNKTTWLDGERVVEPPHQAIIFNHSKALRVHGASFQIHWPRIAKAHVPQYRSLTLDLARQLHADPEIFDLTNLENGLDSVPSTAPGTRPASRRGTPFVDQSHVKVEELGRGASGLVWKAVDRMTGDLIAVKQLRWTQDNIRLLEREIKNMRDLHHENIIQLINWRLLDEYVELDLEYCCRGTLSSMMDDVKTKSKLLFSHIASGLEHLHALDLIHRDIKPDNILVQGLNGQLHFKLADFGFSNFADLAFTFCGSPIYMAPEVNMRERQTSRLDIYSLGVVLLQVLGCFQRTQWPRMPNTPVPKVLRELQSIISKEAFDFHPGNDQADLLRRMISRNANHRPTATQCLEFLHPGGLRENRHDATTSANYRVSNTPGRTELRVQRRQSMSPHVEAGLDIKATTRRTQQVALKLRPQPRATAPIDGDMKRGGLQADDIVQVGQILRSKKKQIVDRNQRHPSIIRTNTKVQPVDNRAKVLQHQKTEHDGKVVKKKRRTEQDEGVKRMPGAWID